VSILDLKSSGSFVLPLEFFFSLCSLGGYRAQGGETTAGCSLPDREQQSACATRGARALCLRQAAAHAGSQPSERRRSHPGAWESATQTEPAGLCITRATNMLSIA